MALAILRIIGEEARKDGTARVIAQLPVDVSTYLLNEKREWVNTIEQRHDVSIVLVPNPDLETPNHRIRRVREDEIELPENAAASYRMADREDEESDLPYGERQEQAAPPAPAVKGIVPQSPAPPRAKVDEQAAGASTPGMIKRFFNWLFENDADSDTKKPKKKAQRKAQPKRQADSGRGKPRPAQRRPRKKTSGKKPAKRSKRSDAGPDEKQSQTKSGQAKRGRSRGRRGGRRRRGPRQGEDANQNAQSQQGNQPARSDVQQPVRQDQQPGNTEKSGGARDQSERGKSRQAPANEDNRRPQAASKPAPEAAREATASGPAKTREPGGHTARQPAETAGVVERATTEAPASDKYTVWSSGPAEGRRGPGRDE